FADPFVFAFDATSVTFRAFTVMLALASAVAVDASVPLSVHAPVYVIDGSFSATSVEPNDALVVGALTRFWLSVAVTVKVYVEPGVVFSVYVVAFAETATGTAAPPLTEYDAVNLVIVPSEFQRSVYGTVFAPAATVLADAGVAVTE